VKPVTTISPQWPTTCRALRHGTQNRWYFPRLHTDYAHLLMVYGHAGVSLPRAIERGGSDMVKTMVLRCLQVFAIAFVLSCLATLSLDRSDHASAMLNSLTSPTETYPSTAVASELPNVAMETTDGTRTSFAATGGHVRIATMFYSHCPGVCPLTIDALKGIDRQLTAQQRTRLSFVLLSLDPARDSPQTLRSLALERGLTSSHWILGRTSEEDARSFAAFTHIRYRALSDGSIDHSSALVLLDEQGRVLARVSDEADMTEFVAAARRALDQQ
jgi:protein SCO1